MSLTILTCIASQVWEGFKLQCVQPITINASLNEDIFWLTEGRLCMKEVDYLLV